MNEQELETIQEMLNAEGERAAAWDNDSKETEQLRMRVRELELERERVGFFGVCGISWRMDVATV